MAPVADCGRADGAYDPAIPPLRDELVGLMDPATEKPPPWESDPAWPEGFRKVSSWPGGN